MKLNTPDVVTIMSQASAGVGLLVVVFSSLRVNDLNLYSSSLGVANFIEIVSGKKSSWLILTLIIGLFSTLLSVFGILDRFVDFLTLLGIFFPPVIGVMLTDYFIIRSHRAVLEKSRQQGELPADTPLIGLCAIAASVAGGVAGYIITQGVPALTSLLTGSLFYGILKCTTKYQRL
ncbi:hypothetical protein BTJ39_00060 [Izhakiella australiensis]|uniref:Cytosine permease n=1 Tax=Izhakiella australiensis TaxID=1926881 RepID=A0A1S8YQY2_9GAMM|nr:cytosine permease [Izhakiella australiensis]OON41601.1 hypothetical protein BTJ39_00060 [Izhakiella australiensis]